MTLPKIFFILGCQRSGTTLMRLILESHSKIFCVDENRSYPILSNQTSLKDELKKNRGKKWLGFKTPRITEQMLEPYLADVGIQLRTKNRYKRMPIIFLIRNVLDTVTSMKTLDQDGTSWIKRWAKRTIDFWCETTPNFKSNFKQELKLLGNTKNKDIVAGAIYWKYKTSSFYKYENNGVPIIRIKYEDLVIEKKATIKKVLNFLNLSWENSVLEHEKLSHVETNQSGITVGNNDTRIPIHKASIDRYKKFLTKKEIFEILQVAGDSMTKLGYNV